MIEISVSRLVGKLSSGEEVALLDVREEGRFSQGHQFLASCLPFSRLELRASSLVPNRNVPVVVVDDDGGARALAAARRLQSLGYTDVRRQAGGLGGWVGAGHQLFSGVNVPSKAFGEFVHATRSTPELDADELLKRLRGDGSVIVIDCRPFAEYHRMNIPGSINLPGVDLPLRIFDAVPDESTTIVVNCAGRTRSIIGTQSLVNMGIANPIYALKNGTMGWELAGGSLETGQSRSGPDPTPANRDRSGRAWQRVAEQCAVGRADISQALDWHAAQGVRTTYLFDVRGPAEFEAGHVPGAVSAPGGQLVQATDRYIGVRGARVVLVDDDGVRAAVTATWLKQMGWRDVWIARAAAADLCESRRGAGRLAPPPMTRWNTVDARTLAGLLAGDDAPLVVDVSTSLQYREAHVPGAYWLVRGEREALERLAPGDRSIVVTGRNNDLVALAAAEVAKRYGSDRVRALPGGNQAWMREGLPVERGLTRPLSEPADVYYMPYEHKDPAIARREMVNYLEWELELVGCLQSEPIDFWCH